MQLDMLQEERDNLHEKVIDKFVILIDTWFFEI